MDDRLAEIAKHYVKCPMGPYHVGIAGHFGVVSYYGEDIVSLCNTTTTHSASFIAASCNYVRELIMEDYHKNRKPDLTKGCSPTLTECPRCLNDIQKCDGVFSTKAIEAPVECANCTRFPSADCTSPFCWNSAKSEKKEAERATITLPLDVWEKTLESLAFYADPDTYFAILFAADLPCGDFVHDFEPDNEYGREMPGALARQTINELDDAGYIPAAFKDDDSAS